MTPSISPLWGCVCTCGTTKSRRACEPPRPGAGGATAVESSGPAPAPSSAGSGSSTRFTSMSAKPVMRRAHSALFAARRLGAERAAPALAGRWPAGGGGRMLSRRFCIAATPSSSSSAVGSSVKSSSESPLVRIQRTGRGDGVTATTTTAPSSAPFRNATPSAGESSTRETSTRCFFLNTLPPPSPIKLPAKIIAATPSSMNASEPLPPPLLAFRSKSLGERKRDGGGGAVAAPSPGPPPDRVVRRINIGEIRYFIVLE